MFWRDDIDPGAEGHKVLLKRGEFVDENRGGRAVPYKIYHPVDHDMGKLPVILWSHGFGGNRDGASFLSRYIASQGYTIVHMTHPGTDSSLWEGKEGHPWDILKKAHVPREITLERFRDVPFVLDQLPGWAQDNSDAGQGMDLSRLGMSGHSFGSMTTQVMAGMKVPDTKETLTSFKDDRFRAGILYSPVPIAHLSDAPPEELYGGIDLPLFHMTGTDDDSPIEGFGWEHRRVVYDTPSGAEKFLLVKKDGDHMVYNGTRGKLAANPKRARHEDLIKVSSHAFWDAYLKDDKKAREWLTGDGFTTYIADDANFTMEE